MSKPALEFSATKFDRLNYLNIQLDVENLNCAIMIRTLLLGILFYSCQQKNTMSNNIETATSGKEQPTSTFVWEVKATDYLGTPYIQKGIVTLIR